jgi:hypothetical protein
LWERARKILSSPASAYLRACARRPKPRERKGTGQQHWPLIERATPNPYVAPGRAQNIGVLGYRALSVRVFNPPPEGGMSDTISQLVRPR